MKKMLKRLSAVCMMLVMMMSLAACGSKEEDTADAIDATMYQYQCASVMESLGMLSDEDIELYMESGDAFTVAAMTAWTDNREELGTYVEVLGTTVELEDEIYVATSDVAFSNKEATVTMNFDETGVPTYLTIEVQYSLGELMGQAALNTVMGMGTVFLVLIFLSLLIGMFKYVGAAADKLTKKPAPAPKAAAPVAAPVVEENLVDDGELVAVIAAAIAASENTSTDSFVVRSIRRKPNNKWSRA